MSNTKSRAVIVGVDTHKSTHVAVAIDINGARLATLSIPANPKGYLELEAWSQSQGDVAAFGIEGTGSYGAELERLVAKRAPNLLASHGIATMTVAEMLILVGDDPTRIRSEAALAKLCGVCPIPASSGKTNRFRLNRGGNRQANAALFRVAIVRMSGHEPTLAYVKKRTREGKSKREIIRCLKRYIVREIFNHLCCPKVGKIAG